MQNYLPLSTNPKQELVKRAKEILDKRRSIELCEASLSEFIQQGWSNIDPSIYKHNWHIDLICEHLEAVSAGEIRNLLINIPPRCMKSITCSVGWPVWDWIKNPSRRFLNASYAQSLSVRDTLKARRLIDSIWFQERWGDRFKLTSDQNTKQRYDNDKGGYRIATSVDGTATGEGGDIITVDDPHSAAGAMSPVQRQSVLDWYDGTMSTRLNDPATGAYVTIMQRLHVKDLAGHIIDQGDLVHLCLPMEYEPKHTYVCEHDIRTEAGELLFPSHHTEESVAKTKTKLGSKKAAGQLQQRPTVEGGDYFQRNWIKVVDDFPRESQGFCRYWDLAGTKPSAKNKDPDWTAGALMHKHGGQYFITGMNRFRDTPLGNRNRIKSQANADGRGVPIHIQHDVGQAAKDQVDSYARDVLVGFAFRAHQKGQKSKIQMADPFAAACEAGNVFIVRRTHDGFGLTEIEIEALLSEIEVFPNGSHDDQVDAVTGAFDRLNSMAVRGSRRRTVMGAL